MRAALDNSAQTVYNYDSTDLRSVTVTAVTADGVETTYTYDANGNTLTAGDKTYTYNDRGQQTGYSNGTTAAAYAYNPSGLRKAKTVGGSTKYFVYNGMNIVYEYSESVADGVAYFYGLNRTHNSEGEIYVYNAHGDVVQLVKDNAVVASYTYDAFGNLTSQIGESDNPFLYCGEYYDAETQTYYLRARYYNPANGRFTQQDAWSFMDTSDPLSLNLYTYCYNNPVMYADPYGTLPSLSQILHLGNQIGNMVLQWGSAILSELTKKDISLNTANVGAFFLMMEKDDSGVYHARFDCWQQYFGYNDFYDLCFNLGTSMHREKFDFTVGDDSYTIWMWKGDYINLGAGAEVGIYKSFSIGGIETEHRQVDTSLALRMLLTLNDKDGNLIFSYSPEDPQWWITGFNPKFMNMDASNLIATITIDFSSSETGKTLYEGFYSKYSTDKRWSFGDGYTATFTY